MDKTFPLESHRQLVSIQYNIHGFGINIMMGRSISIWTDLEEAI